MKKIFCIITAFSIILCAFICPCGAVSSYDEWSQGWESIKNSDGYIILTPGADRTQMNFSWQSPFVSKKGTISISTDSTMKNATPLSVKRSLCIFGFEWTQEATATDLNTDTVYYYQYTSNGNLSDIYNFKTGSSDETTFAYLTDAQIGRSYLSTDEETYSHDTYGWSATLEAIVENNDVDFLLHGGDQVNKSENEDEYTYFESPSTLRYIPLATAIGNHDFYTTNYTHHFYNPNRNTKNIQWPAGNGYYFSYNNILFIVLDSNSIMLSAQYKIMSAAVKAYPDAKWRVVMMHHSPYDANAESQFTNILTRYDVTPVIDKYDVDVVLCGHDHYYSHSYMIKNNKVTSDVEVNNVYTNPTGTIYITGNCASGSNFDEINDEEVNEYTKFYSQTDVTYYTLVNVKANKMNITTYETENNSIIDTVSIVK